VLEYYEKDFVLKAIQEFHRVMKPGGRFVLDISNITSPSGRMAMMIEEYMGRPDKFDMLPLLNCIILTKRIIQILPSSFRKASASDDLPSIKFGTTERVASFFVMFFSKCQ